MQITAEGLALIKRFEGFRGAAYRDAVGVWTVGYGHTSMAGPPTVAGGFEVSREEAQAILARDVEQVARDVAGLVKVPLSDRQFSALVSFAYNVGTGNFRSSSVLTAVNGGDMDAVPRRLQLWTKAGGRVLPGLVKRRAAEAELFIAAKDEKDTRTPVEPAEGKPLPKSTTVWAALAAALASAGATLAAHPLLSLALLGAVLAAVAWIVRERRRKAKEEGV